VGVTHTLCELGMTDEDLPLLAQNALSDACMLTNPKQPTADELIQIFKASC
jgi:alcohol dehydrogenase class IV